ncbi:sensor histidine kinase [Mesonia ostreae]|uniref:histidine kinase n=1 Tax=Mesonia ostreae TaxID=861110 RepID=A0ABU2KJE9_9FLAO|nr:histidine kinase [Mesonia ostreae]MDT0294845.1 histidine kinase [Mesonia ostreae]
MEYESGLKLFFWIGTAIMVGLTLMVLLLTVIYQKKVHKIKQKEAENLLRVSLESEKRERKRVASDLHDSVMGDLNAIRNYMTVLSNEEQHSASPQNPLLQEVETALRKMQENIQEISYNLMPPLLESSGLTSTLENYFDRIKKWNKLNITAKYQSNDIAIPSSIAYELYRIVQELTTNMLKYGKIRNITFSIEKDENILTITVIDDGVPFDFYKNLKNSSGMGLKNIMSRLKQVEASLVQVSVDKGNKIVISLKNTL